MILKDRLAKTFSHIVQALKISKPGERSLERIVEVVREHFNAQMCSLYEFYKENLILVAMVQTKDYKKNPDPLISSVIKKREAVFSVERAALPLIYQENIVGILSLTKNKGSHFDPTEKQFLEFITLQLSGAIQSLTISKRARELTAPIKENKTSLIINGIGVSSGFSIGPAIFIHPGIISGISNPELASQSTQSEGEKLEAALQKTAEDLSLLVKKVEKKLSREESSIFEGHQIMLSDADFRQKLQDEIKLGKSSLETVGHVVQKYIQELSEKKNPRFEGATSDLEELKQRILENLLGMNHSFEKDEWAGIIVAKSLGPSDTFRLDASNKLLGIISMSGGRTSHAAILARSLGIPAVMGAQGIMEKINPGDLLIIDGDKGEIIVNPQPSILSDYELLEEERMVKMLDLSHLAHEPTCTLDGHRIHVEANAGFVSDVKKLRYFGAEGIGLFRTEYFFLKSAKLPTETEQFDLYSQMLRDAQGLPITFRILDAGGDKPLAAIPRAKEANPFLGCRGIRLMLSEPEILKIQLRALLRASIFGSVRLLIPMISGMEELEAVKEILKEVKKELSDKNIAFDPEIPFGLMIEVPSAVAMVSVLITHVDFLSIGTNDLTQYTLAVDRNNEQISSLFEPLHPALLAFISQVAAAGFKAKKPVSICGEMASDPLIIPLLVGLGITSLSMIAPCILMAKKVIRKLNFKEAQAMASEILKASKIQEVKAILTGFQKKLLDSAVLT